MRHGIIDNVRRQQKLREQVVGPKKKENEVAADGLDWKENGQTLGRSLTEESEGLEVVMCRSQCNARVQY